MRGIEAVSLDMAGTLVHLGFELFRDGAEELPEVWDDVVAWREQPPAGGRGRDLAAFLAARGLPDAEARARAVIRREADSLRPYGDTLATLRELRARGYRLVLVSNVSGPGELFREGLARAGVLPLLEATVFSYDVGVRKPDPAIFRRALDAVGVPPERAVHVGDMPTRDVLGARRAGMRAVHLDRGRSGGPGVEPAGASGPDAPAADHRVAALAGLLELLPPRSRPAP